MACLSSTWFEFNGGIIMTNIASPFSIPNVYATLGTAVSSVTGDGTVYTLVWDTLSFGSGYNVSTGVFTAPMNGDYLFLVDCYMTNLTSSHTSCIMQLISTSNSYTFKQFNIESSMNSSNSFLIQGFIPTRMSKNDTSSITIQISNGTKVASFSTLSTLSVVRLY